MPKEFNVICVCYPDKHYMVDITPKLKQIKTMVDNGDYFTIARPRQYGKTTTLKALKKYLANDYIVLSLDFQALSTECYSSTHIFTVSFVWHLLETIEYSNFPNNNLDKNLLKQLEKYEKIDKEIELDDAFSVIDKLISKALKPVVLIIDEIDYSTNFYPTYEFLLRLRASFLNRFNKPTFKSVILCGLSQISFPKSMLERNKLQKDFNPWDIAAEFLVDMSFNKEDIKEMLKEYEKDYHTGMDLDLISKLIYDSTSGYPYLVSYICKTIDEEVAGTEDFSTKSSAWTKAGYLEAESMLLHENGPLFSNIFDIIEYYKDLEKTIYDILFLGINKTYENEPWISMAKDYGIIKNNTNKVEISNRIFEMRFFHNLLWHDDECYNLYHIGSINDYECIINNELDMNLLLKYFVKLFNETYGDKSIDFIFEYGRKYFLSYIIKTIIGKGYYYIDAKTRDYTHSDLIINYNNEEFIIEIRIIRQGYHTVSLGILNI